VLSSPQFQSGQPLQYHQDTPPPLSLSKSTANSAAQATAWRTSSLGSGRPLAQSKQTSGSTFNWGDSEETKMPSSDKGAGRNA
jgi:hypothetical protein